MTKLTRSHNLLDCVIRRVIFFECLCVSIFHWHTLNPKRLDGFWCMRCRWIPQNRGSDRNIIYQFSKWRPPLGFKVSVKFANWHATECYTTIYYMCVCSSNVYMCVLIPLLTKISWTYQVCMWLACICVLSLLPAKVSRSNYNYRWLHYNIYIHI